jgi:hypothetical protein
MSKPVNKKSKAGAAKRPRPASPEPPSTGAHEPDEEMVKLGLAIIDGVLAQAATIYPAVTPERAREIVERVIRERAPGLSTLGPKERPKRR